MKNIDREDLNQAPWHVRETFDTIHDKASFFETLILRFVDKHLHQKKMRVRHQDVPYMKSEWKTAIRAKRRAARKYLKESTMQNLEIRRKTRNEATRLRRKAI